MITNRSVWLATPVPLLIAARALFGADAAEVAKPQPEPEGEWEVTIPSCDFLADYSVNLCGRLSTTDTDTGDIGSSRDGETRLQMSGFTLVVLNRDWGEASALKVPARVTLRSIEFVAHGVQ